MTALRAVPRAALRTGTDIVDPLGGDGGSGGSVFRPIGDRERALDACRLLLAELESTAVPNIRLLRSRSRSCRSDIHAGQSLFVLVPCRIQNRRYNDEIRREPVSGMWEETRERRGSYDVNWLSA